MALTPQEEAELAQLEAQYAQQTTAVPSGLTPQEEAELAQLEAQHGGAQNRAQTPKVGEVPDVWSKLRSLGAGTLDYGIRGLDYLGGLTRTGVAQGADVFSPNDVVREGDWGRAIRGQAPQSADYLERLGVEKGGSLSDVVPGLYSNSGAGLPLQRGGWLDPSARGAAGFAMDVASDPLTYVGVTPVAKGVKKIGESVFKSGFKNIDKKLAETSTKPLSQVFLDRGVGGTTLKGMQKKTVNLMETLSKERATVYNALDEAGATVDMQKALGPAMEYTARLRDNPGMVSKANELDDFLSQYLVKNPSISRASNWKTDLRNSLPTTAFNQNGRITDEYKKVLQKLSTGLNTEIKASADNVIPGAGNKVSQINADWGSVINSQKPLTTEVNKAATKNLVSAVDAMIGGYGVADPLKAAGVFGAKKTIELLNTPWARTNVGSGLMKLSNTGTLDPLVRQSLIRNNQEEPAPTSAWQGVRGY